MKLLLTIKDKDSKLHLEYRYDQHYHCSGVKYILEQKCMEPELDSDILTREV